jgi:hypothetical protein
MAWVIGVVLAAIAALISNLGVTLQVCGLCWSLFMYTHTLVPLILASCSRPHPHPRPRPRHWCTGVLVRLYVH